MEIIKFQLFKTKKIRTWMNIFFALKGAEIDADLDLHTSGGPHYVEFPLGSIHWQSSQSVH